MRYLVTGGLGFIGHTVVNRLVYAGHEVFALDNNDNPSGSPPHSDAQIIHADITDDSVIDAIARVSADVIIHTAAQVSVPVSYAFPERDAVTNVGGTYNVVTAARRTWARLVNLSSGGAIYGQVHYASEDETPHPASPYGQNKLIAERLVASYENSVTLRLSNVYGPGQEAGVIGLLTAAIVDGTTFKLTAGFQTRDFVHVYDVVDAIEVASTYLSLHGVYNVSTGQETPISKLPQIIHQALDGYASPNYRILQDWVILAPGDVEYSSMDHSLLTQHTGWRPTFTLQDIVGALL